MIPWDEAMQMLARAAAHPVRSMVLPDRGPGSTLARGEIRDYHGPRYPIDGVPGPVIAEIQRPDRCWLVLYIDVSTDKLKLETEAETDARREHRLAADDARKARRRPATVRRVP
ncbi:MAG: hypothetical protein DRI48_10145, partial [Chloroflexi bacterium]